MDGAFLYVARLVRIVTIACGCCGRGAYNILHHQWPSRKPRSISPEQRLG